MHASTAKLGLISLLTSGSANLHGSLAKVLWIKKQKFCMAVQKRYTTANQGSLTLIHILLPLSFLCNTSKTLSLGSVSVFFALFGTHFSFLLRILLLHSLSLSCLCIVWLLLIFYPPHVLLPLCFISHAACSFSLSSSSHLICLIPIPIYFNTDWISCSPPLLRMISSHFPNCLQHFPHFSIKQTATLFSMGMGECMRPCGSTALLYLPIAPLPSP